MMRYALITTDGDLHFKTGDWKADLGTDGYARVRLYASGLPIAGWVSDCGLIMPEKYARNPVGAAMLCSLGAGIQPYAGPVVITGWDADPYEADVAEMRDYEADYLPKLHADVRRVLAGEPLDDERLRSWAELIREIAEIASTGDVPPIRIITPGGSQ